jgi:hypothetical protein
MKNQTYKRDVKIAAHFVPNKLLAVNKNNAQHNEIKSRLTIANKSNALHLNQMNLDVMLPEVFKMTNLIRLDLSYNNIVKLDVKISNLTNLQ